MANILVIEDEPGLRRNVKKILTLEGHEVLEAADGEAGLQSALFHLPDLIICDIMLPGRDGYAVLEALRDNAGTYLTPFIFLTAKADMPSLRKGMNTGADDYLPKPFEPENLISAINVRLSRQAKIIDKFEELRNGIGHMLPHELRTPLVGILGLSEVLQERAGELPESKITGFGRLIHKSGKRLERLIDNYLLYAELTLQVGSNTGQNEWRNQKTLLLPVLSQVVEVMSIEYHHKDTAQISLPTVSLYISETDLNKLLFELVDNAFKFSKPGAPITIRGGIEEDHVPPEFSLLIRNEGRGMHHDEIAAIGAYTQFRRDHQEQQGVGLGLAIAKCIAELYQGRIEIRSEPDQYTELTVFLRLAECHNPDPKEYTL